MGGCFSSRSDGDAECRRSDAAAAANVVSIGGELRRYSLPATVADVLQSMNGVFLCDSDSLAFDEYIPRLKPDHSLRMNGVFLCDSDSLAFDEYIPRLKPDHSLRRDSIYFVLPVSRLRHRVSASDVAELAVKASVAINNLRKKSPMISPAVFGDWKAIEDDYGVKRSPTRKSVSKLARNSSRRAKLAARSVKVRLCTIYEGSVLLFD